MRYWILLALLTGAGACSSPEGGDMAPPAPVSETPAEKAISSPGKPTSAELSDAGVPELAHGNHFVFGLRMPRGMMPMKAASKGVYRFDGTHSIEALKKYLFRQLAAPVSVEKNRFSDGYFVSNAQPKERQDEDRYFNVKIVNGTMGGGAVEVWLVDTPVGNPHRTGMETYEAARATYQKKAKEGDEPVKTPQYSSRGEKAKATFRVFDKMANGEPLTEEDYNSPYFTDM